MPTTSRLDSILERLHTIQAELDSEIDRLSKETADKFSYTLKRGRVRFEAGIRTWQQRRKTGLWIYVRDARLAHVLSAPLIYSLLLPIIWLDAAATLYQHVCFRIYGIPVVTRSDFVVVDRQYLAYLNIIEKLNCMYCGYANGVIAYTREIAARTEQFWCPIKHARRSADPHTRSRYFADYGDADAYQNSLETLRSNWDKNA